ncbi:hypothetical protein pdam_00022291 [Pocillopora damicornis]|uniref:Uncharacterized protein n=1 Tax=Pocillopora damicornis TaxID=46731 RepID=A0A3M6UD55_POCDA|nr:hypothetical protein pdam_00022291 [Pocillopora damicornis]
MDCVKRRDMREHPSGSTLPAEIHPFIEEKLNRRACKVKQAYKRRCSHRERQETKPVNHGLC